MMGKISKVSLNYILLIIATAVMLFNNYELTFIVWLLIAFITTEKNYSFQFIKILSCFILILIISILTDLFFYQNNLYYKIRDLAYLLKPILGLLIGYNLSKKMKLKTFDYLIKCGFVLALIHNVLVVITILRFTTLSVAKIREYCGYFNDFEPYILLLILFNEQFNIVLSKQKKQLYCLIIGVSIFFYLSRTNFIQFVILLLAIKGYLIVNKKSLKIILYVLSFSLIGYSLIYQYNPRRNGKAFDEFLYKIKITPYEAFKTKINEDDWKDFNDNFRSFENIKTFNQVFNGEVQPAITGNGLGATVDIGRRMWTNDGTFVRYYPVLHNAFSTVLLKSGLLGILIYCLSIYYVGEKKFKNLNNSVVNNINLLLFGSAIFLIFSSWVFMGFYLKLDNKSIIIGMLIAYREFIANKLDKRIV
jgi:hypothetical protein